MPSLRRTAYSLIVVLLAASRSTFLIARAQIEPSSQWPILDNGLTDTVEWDHYSVRINDRRLFLFAGEMHYWRLPVPELWRDILEKIKAAGFTGFTFYSDWGYHAPNATTLDFTTGAYDISPLYQIAKEIGLYFIMRPGPYINAEANAGGFPLWLTTGAYGSLRDNDPRYTEAYRPYIEEFSRVSRPYQITNGENGIMYQIENELGQQWIGDPTDRVPDLDAAEYMEIQQAMARESGIDVPLMHNNPNLYTRSWSEDFAPGARGNVDIYGLDNYPSCWTCDISVCTATNGATIPYQVFQYYDHFQTVSPNQPSFIPEFQGGAYNPWGGPQGGCPGNIDADYANLFYRHNIAERVTAINLYMMFGGTNWGAFAAPVVATSYDYSAPISETRAMDAKFYETKLLSLFTRAAQDLTETDRIQNSTNLTTNSAVLATELRNPRTSGAFYVTRHLNSSSDSLETFMLRANTSEGVLTIPQRAGSITLNGHQSKIIVTDFRFGSGHLVYSTAEVLSYIITDGTPTLFLWAPSGETAEFYVRDVRYGWAASQRGCSNMALTKGANGMIVSLMVTEGMSVFLFTAQRRSLVRVVVMDRQAAYRAWVPALSADPFAPPEETVFVQGPYLVRSSLIDGRSLSIRGDSAESGQLEVFAPRRVRVLQWNGETLKTSRTRHGSLVARLSGPTAGEIALPLLSSWRSADSLPERLTAYDDSGPAWAVANRTETPNPTKPATLPVLYVDEYGFHNGIHLWRGTFDGMASGVNLSVAGGTAFGWSAWLNGDFIGSFLGSASLAQGTFAGSFLSNPELEQGNLTLSFGNATVNAEGPNTLLVVQDNTGHDQQPEYLNPRGITQVTLVGGANFSSWKVAGTAGGDAVQLDPVRGALAEGGLYAERLGWHLPGFDDSSWSDVGAPETGLNGAGIRFYRTVVPLNIPAGHDVSISFVLSAPGSQKLRAQLFVNGYQYGRFNPWIGNQIVFPVPPGILDYQGDNVIGVALWAQSEEGGQVGIEWKVDYAVESSLNVLFDGTYLRPAWSAERLAYA